MTLPEAAESQFASTLHSIPIRVAQMAPGLNQDYHDVHLKLER
jgi:hypothetical protein